MVFTMLRHCLFVAGVYCVFYLVRTCAIPVAVLLIVSYSSSYNSYIYNRANIHCEVLAETIAISITSRARSTPRLRAAPPLTPAPLAVNPSAKQVTQSINHGR